MPNKFTPSPRELINRSWLVDISGGSKLGNQMSSDYQPDTWMQHFDLQSLDRFEHNEY